MLTTWLVSPSSWEYTCSSDPRIVGTVCQCALVPSSKQWLSCGCAPLSPTKPTGEHEIRMLMHHVGFNSMLLFTHVL